ncbi:hypothetical protein OG898_10375 [Streptomyces sp. NBC_00193]|uniref:hypothetical protein n=1 Tax=Streptomyces sp. NBC_00193 TaxID=2975675 RepID=UPI0022521734|nr:hypothetical protein [Streptomyces sp. NBC_00193]MCX5296894.1 hypothetical protein [Streptomyces sp. NBC_00193]
MSALVSLTAGLLYVAIAALAFDDGLPTLLFTAGFGAAGIVLASAGARMLAGHRDQVRLARRGAWLALLTITTPVAVWAVNIGSSDAPAAFTQLAISQGALTYVASATVPAILTLLLVRTRVRR